MKPIWIAALALAISSPAVAQQTDAAFRTTTLNLSADGEIQARPDLAVLTLGVSAEAAQASAATAEVARRVDAILRALQGAGVAERDIQTQWVQLTPRYSDRSGAPREIIAHQARTSLSVKIRRTERAGALLDSAVAAGANEVQGVRFTLEDSAAAERQARDAALKTLTADAAQIADSLGLRVVRLVSVQARAFAGRGYGRVEEIVVTGSRLNPGAVEVQSGVSGVFELAPK